MTVSDLPTNPMYETIGGEIKVRELVDQFYDLMELEADFKGIRALHPSSLDASRDKLFWFLCGWMGGPDYYVSKFGHPRLRMRHCPYAIGIAERDQWLVCMGRAMQDVHIAPILLDRLLESFMGTADWMRNKEN